MEFSVYKNSLSLWTTSGDEELIGAIVKVSSLGFCAECECEDVAEKIGTTVLFWHIGYIQEI